MLDDIIQCNHFSTFNSYMTMKITNGIQLDLNDLPELKML